MTAHQLILNPAARVLWRSAASVQLELGSRALVLDELDDRAVRGLLGSNGHPASGGSPDGSPAAVDADTVDALYASGFLVPAPGGGGDEVVHTAAQVPRMAADLAALQVRHGSAAVRVLAGRRAAAVTVHGRGRLAAMTAAVVAAAGVGRVHAPGTAVPGSRRGEAVRVADTGPGGFLPRDEGRPVADALRDVIARAAPESATGPGGTPDLVLLVSEDPLGDLADDQQRAALHGGQIPHLAVRAGGDLGAVGPLVVPGRSSCLRCADLHRADRDPAWSALAVQLAVPRRGAAPADVALCATIAGLAAVQALSWIDGEQPAVLAGTLELRLPGWQVRRRSWPAHPSCGCGAHRAAPAAGQLRELPRIAAAADPGVDWAEWPA